jgi:hypothetical protein
VLRASQTGRVLALKAPLEPSGNLYTCAHVHVRVGLAPRAQRLAFEIPISICMFTTLCLIVLCLLACRMRTIELRVSDVAGARPRATRGAAGFCYKVLAPFLYTFSCSLSLQLSQVYHGCSGTQSVVPSKNTQCEARIHYQLRSGNRLPEQWSACSTLRPALIRVRECARFALAAA